MKITEKITRYGDIGTSERHSKFGGVKVTVIDGQPVAICGITDYLDAFLIGKIFTQEQYNAVYQLVRDYQIGFLYKWRVVKEYIRSAGLSEEEAEEQRESARINFNAALKHNPEFMKLANFAHLLLDAHVMDVAPTWKLVQLADRLIKFYH